MQQKHQTRKIIFEKVWISIKDISRNGDPGETKFFDRTEKSAAELPNRKSQWTELDEVQLIISAVE